MTSKHNEGTMSANIPTLDDRDSLIAARQALIADGLPEKFIRFKIPDEGGDHETRSRGHGSDDPSNL